MRSLVAATLSALGCCTAVALDNGLALTRKALVLLPLALPAAGTVRRWQAAPAGMPAPWLAALALPHGHSTPRHALTTADRERVGGCRGSQRRWAGVAGTSSRALSPTP